jgi:hypothetical protein
MPAPALAAYGQFGFELQSVEGSQALGTDPAWLPLCAPNGFQWVPNIQILNMGDSLYYERAAFSGGQWWAGAVKFYLTPGHASAISSWIQTRDAYGQGKFATVWQLDTRGDGTSVWRGVGDVKVASASFEFTPRSPVVVTLNLLGISAAASVANSVAVATAAPYITKDCVFSYIPNASVGTSDGWNLKNLTLNINNHLQSPEEGMRLNSSYCPYRLYNEGYMSVSGSFLRDYQDQQIEAAIHSQAEWGTALDDWWEQTYDGSLVVTMTRGVVLTATVARVRYTDWSNQLPGSRVGALNEAVQFAGLSSYNAGWISPIVFS